jgi:hypothetical protein
MTTEMAEGQTRHKITRSLSKRAATPLAQAAVTAGTAYLTRKAMQLWQEKLQPKIEEKGGAGAIATDAIENVKSVAEQALPDSMPTSSSSSKSSSSEAERRQRKQRREQRARALDKSRSS